MAVGYRYGGILLFKPVQSLCGEVRMSTPAYAVWSEGQEKSPANTKAL